LEKTIVEIPWIRGIHEIHGIHGIQEIRGIRGIQGIQEFPNVCNSRISPNFQNLENKILEFGEKISEKSGIPRIY
jgi:hypothetical protein